MTEETLVDLFEYHDQAYLCFDDIKDKLHHRPDIHAFILLDQLTPGDMNIITGAEHGEIFLDTDIEKFCAIATEEHILDLIRCGVRLFDGGYFGMFT